MYKILKEILEGGGTIFVFKKWNYTFTSYRKSTGLLIEHFD